jgi:hypothetical protein
MKTRAVKLIFSAAIVFILGMGNFLFPVICFSNKIANELTVILILSMPLLIIIISAWLPKHWAKLLFVGCLVPIIGLCFIIQLFAGYGVYANLSNQGNTALKHNQAFVNGSEVYCYDEGLPGSSFGVIVRQEREFLPGILFVRHLYTEDPAIRFNFLEVAGPDSVRIVMRDSAKPDLVIPVRRFVWF